MLMESARQALASRGASSVVRTVKGLIRVGLDEAQGRAGAKDAPALP